MGWGLGGEMGVGCFNISLRQRRVGEAPTFWFRCFYRSSQTQKGVRQNEGSALNPGRRAQTPTGVSAPHFEGRLRGSCLGICWSNEKLKGRAYSRHHPKPQNGQLVNWPWVKNGGTPKMGCPCKWKQGLEPAVFWSF